MKKILMVMILMTAVPAYATVEVQYNNAGAVKSVTTPVQNAIFTPDYARQAGAIQRQIKNERAFYDSLNKSKEVNVNINTTINSAAASDTASVSDTDSTSSTTSSSGRKFIKGKYLKDRLNSTTEE